MIVSFSSTLQCFNLYNFILSTTKNRIFKGIISKFRHSVEKSTTSFNNELYVQNSNLIQMCSVPMHGLTAEVHIVLKKK